MVSHYVLNSKYLFFPCFSVFSAGYKIWLPVNIKKFYLILLSLQLKHYTFTRKFHK